MTTLDQLARDLRVLNDEANGCCLHVAVGDYNLSDDSLRFCERYALERAHNCCALLAKTFRERVPEEHREAFLGVRVEEDADGWGSTVHPVEKPWRGEA